MLFGVGIHGVESKSLRIDFNAPRGGFHGLIAKSKDLPDGKHLQLGAAWPMIGGLSGARAEIPAPETLPPPPEQS